MAQDGKSYAKQVELVTSFINDLSYASGDASHDLSYYRRRVALFTLYTQSMLVFTNDTSVDLQVTRRFIERNTPKLIW